MSLSLYLLLTLVGVSLGKPAYDGTGSAYPYQPAPYTSYDYQSETSPKLQFPSEEEPAPGAGAGAGSRPEGPSAGAGVVPEAGSVGASAGPEAGPEVLRALPPGADLDNLTPEQKELFEELIGLADEEDAPVQGRTFGLVKHKFAYLWNKFVSLFPHKFFEFEHIPGPPAYGHLDTYPLKRVQDKYPPVQIRFPSLFSGITRFFANTLPLNGYDSVPVQDPYHYGGIHTKEENED